MDFLINTIFGLMLSFMGYMVGRVMAETSVAEKEIRQMVTFDRLHDKYYQKFLTPKSLEIFNEFSRECLSALWQEPEK